MIASTVVVSAGVAFAGYPDAVLSISGVGLFLSACVSVVTAIAVSCGENSDRMDPLPPSAAALVFFSLSSCVSMAQNWFPLVSSLGGSILITSTLIHYYPPDQLKSIARSAAAMPPDVNFTSYCCSGVPAPDPTITAMLHVGLADGTALILVAVVAAYAHARYCIRLALYRRMTQKKCIESLAAIALRADSDMLPAIRIVLHEISDFIKEGTQRRIGEQNFEPRPVSAASAPLQRAFLKSAMLCRGSVSYKQVKYAAQQFFTTQTQAEVLSVLIQHKVQELALLSHGRFPVAGQGFVKAQTLAEDPAFAAMMPIPAVKTVNEGLSELGAMQLCNCCSGKLACLGPCCRTDIYFGDLGGVLAALEASRRDPEIQLVNCREYFKKIEMARGATGWIGDLLTSHINPELEATIDWHSGCQCGADSGAAESSYLCAELQIKIVSALAQEFQLQTIVCELRIWLLQQQDNPENSDRA